MIWLLVALLSAFALLATAWGVFASARRAHQSRTAARVRASGSDTDPAPGTTLLVSASSCDTGGSDGGGGGGD